MSKNDINLEITHKIGLVISTGGKIEKLLRELGASGEGLAELIESVNEKTRPEVKDNLHTLRKIRNQVAHEPDRIIERDLDYFLSISDPTIKQLEYLLEAFCDKPKEPVNLSGLKPVITYRSRKKIISTEKTPPPSLNLKPHSQAKNKRVKKPLENSTPESTNTYIKDKKPIPPSNYSAENLEQEPYRDFEQEFNDFVKKSFDEIGEASRQREKELEEKRKKEKEMERLSGLGLGGLVGHYLGKAIANAIAKKLNL